jgi:hypothetical protein
MRLRYFVALAIAVIVSAAVVVFALPPAGSGSITGKVTYMGTPPKLKPIDMSKEPSCAKQHATPVTAENVVTGPGNSLEWVVVYISAGERGGGGPSQAARYDQKGCQYVPHVLPLEADQQLQIYNDDQTSHNIHPLAKINQEWNKSQPHGSPPIDTKWEKPEFIPVKCNIHPWMSGQFAVMKNSHFSISAGDGGFTLPNLPPGKYTVTAWHESYGDQSMEVTIAGSETKTVNFVFKAKPY